MKKKAQLSLSLWTKWKKLTTVPYPNTWRRFTTKSQKETRITEKISHVPPWSEWKRPSSVPYPNTWHRFTAKSRDGKIYNIKIVDLTPDRFEEALDFMEKNLYSNEPLTGSTKLLDDEVSLHNFQLIENVVSDQRISIIAVLDEDVPKPEMVGIQKLYVENKGDEAPKNVPGSFIQKFYKLLDDAENGSNPFEIFNTDTIMRGYGIAVKREYRGLDIGYNIVITIEKVARAFGIKAFVAYYSNIRPQKVVEKLGFKLLNEVAYDEYKDDQEQRVFPVVGKEKLKYMGIEYV